MLCVLCVFFWLFLNAICTGKQIKLAVLKETAARTTEHDFGSMVF